jgi:hypothetical protein
MSMAKKKPRFKTKLAADAYHFLIENTEDKKDYELGDRMYAYVYVTYYDCYIYVHCVLYHDDKAEDLVTFASSSTPRTAIGDRDFTHINTKLFGNRKKYD